MGGLTATNVQQPAVGSHQCVCQDPCEPATRSDARLERSALECLDKGPENWWTSGSSWDPLAPARLRHS